jgi:hypothetical protein
LETNQSNPSLGMEKNKEARKKFLVIRFQKEEIHIQFLLYQMVHQLLKFLLLEPQKLIEEIELK